MANRRDRVVDVSRMDATRSPIHRAVWEEDVPLDLFTPEASPMPTAVRDALDRSLELVRRRRRAGTLYDERGIVSADTIGELSGAGYWGLRVESRYGGAGASFATLAQAITEMVPGDPWVAGMASTQAALGPVSLLQDVGTPEQKERLLPPLARGERLGAFAVTEPGASSDWGRVRTTARRDGDRLLVRGEKLFITNAAPGRTVALMCRLDDRLEMLVLELPWHEDESFKIVEYELRAPAHLSNVGLRFRDLPVPMANLLVPRSGDGRTIAHRAVSHGRVAVCAVAAGALRQIAGSVIPWVRHRETFGAPIGTRELVQRRLGRLAARIVACDALTIWAATLLDEGYGGELECVAAKVFASEAIKDATVDILLKTHGGRAFLDGNLFADTVHDFLAPTIYEGENEIITLGFFARLVKGGAWDTELAGRRLGPPPRGVPGDADGLTQLAGHLLHGCALEIDRLLRELGPGVAARQAVAHEIATRVQHATVLLLVSRYAAHHADPLVRDAGMCMAMELGHQLVGVRPSARYQQLLTDLGAAVVEDRFAPAAGAERGAIVMAECLPGSDALAERPEHDLLLH